MGPTYDETVIDYGDLRLTLGRATGDAELFELIVNAPFEDKINTTFFFLGIFFFFFVNNETGEIDRVALSNTELARNTTEVSVVPFEEIKIHLTSPDNIIASAIRSDKPQDTIDWKTLFTPVLSAKQARINQASAGIAYSAVYPLAARDGGALIFSYYQYKEDIGEVQQDFMAKYSRIVNDSLTVKRAA